MWGGLEGSSSTILRRREICTSIERSNTSYSRPRASSMSLSRDSGSPGRVPPPPCPGTPPRGRGVDVVAFCRQHDDRRGVLLRAQAPADGEPVLAGKHEVEHHQVVALARELLVHAAAVGDRLDVVAFAAEVADQKIA